MAKPFAFRDLHALDDLGGPADRYARNVAALRLLRTIEAERRSAADLSEAERLTLAHYTGFAEAAVLNRAFHDAARIDPAPGADARFSPSDDLHALTTEDEQASIRRTALTAFYTPLPVVAAIWDALARMGLGDLPTLRVLEPAAGTGNFLSLMPAALRARAEITAVELDQVTARILTLLHPDARVFAGVGFERVALPPAHFDLAISNVPFSDVGVADPTLEPFLTRTLHDFCFARALTLVRPGGLVCFLTSYGTLDKADSRVRAWLAERARLLAAVRLPNGVFRANAGSEAGTDLIILQVAHPGETPDEAPWRISDWAALPRIAPTSGMTTGSRYGHAGPPGMLRVSRHFTAHPDQVVGTMGMVVQSGSTWLHVAPPAEPVADALAARLAALPTGIIRPARHDVAPTSAPAAEALPVTPPTPIGPDAARAEGLLMIYAAAKRLIQLEVTTAPEAEVAAARRQLNTDYDRFTAVYGVIHARTNRRLLKDMPELGFLLALEIEVHERRGSVTAHKAPIFAQPTVRPARPRATVLSPGDALLVCLDERGRVDLDHIVALSGLPRHAVLDALRGVIYRLPDAHAEHYETADAYLSGNIRAKLRAAEAMATIDPAYADHVAVLTAALPAPLTPGEIVANLGASWIPPEDVADFIRSLIPSFGTGRVIYHRPLAKWELHDDAYARHSVEATSTWGTARSDALSIIAESLNSRVVVVYDVWREDGVERRRVNDSETLAAQDKQTQIKERFQSWVWEEPARAERLATSYNERYNSVRLRQYDGAHLSLPGINTTALRGGDLAPWQKDAVWQALQNPTTLIGHVVGAGKTFELLAIAHEARRMGLVAKPMVIVPNHLVEQWAQEAHRLYPGMRVLAMAPEDFSRANRGRYLSLIATGSWDLVIVAHTSFRFLPVGAATMRAFVGKRVRALRAFLEELQAEDGKRQTLKEIEKRIARHELRLAQAEQAIDHDDERTITWDELGVDLLLVDEAHEFKNLEIETRMDRVAGVPRSGSQRAFDLWVKTWDLLRRGGRVVFATGTPVANTLAEVFVMMRYLQPDLLESLGLEFFDAWAAAFAQTQMSFEMRPDGSGFRLNTRLNRFVNLPELATLWRQCLNVRTAEQLNLPRPRLAGGRPTPVVIPPSPRLKAFVASLVERVEQIKNRQVSPEVDNMLRITGEGRLAALDLRFILGGPEEPQCKINALVERVARIYHATDARRGAQLVFCDLATPKGSDPTPTRDDVSTAEADDACANECAQRGFVYHEIRAKLVAHGLPREEIAFIHEHASRTRRETLFADVRAGRVRVLIGSTAKMGTGMNVQARLAALHHLDAPWRPCDIEQREGRILRQGNQFEEVQIFQYVTEGSFDGYLWQLLENKARFISQIMVGEITQRTADDVAEVVLTAAEIKALASGNPQIVQKVQLDAELGRLERVRAVWRNSRLNLQRELEHGEQTLIEQARRSAAFAYAVSVRDANQGAFALMITSPTGEAVTLTDREAAGRALRKAARVWVARDLAAARDRGGTPRAIGAYRGLTLTAQSNWLRAEPGEVELHLTITYEGRRYELAALKAESDSGVIASLDYHVRSLEDQVAALAQARRRVERRQTEVQAELARPWEGAETYTRVKRELARLDAELGGTGATPITAEEEASDLAALLAAATALTCKPAEPIEPVATVATTATEHAPTPAVSTAAPLAASADPELVADPSPAVSAVPAEGAVPASSALPGEHDTPTETPDRRFGSPAITTPSRRRKAAPAPTVVQLSLFSD